MVAKPAKSTAPTKAAKKTGTARKPSRSHTPTQGLYGWITHTELASSNPAATKAWCSKALGWKFKPSLPMPGGEYHLFTYSDLGGGGIRATESGEAPGSTPTVHVEDCTRAVAKAVRAGAEVVSPPQKVMEGVVIALVKAPGGVLIGLSGGK